MGNCAPHQLWLCWPGDVVCGIMLACCNRGMIGCLEFPFTRLAKLESNCAVAAWYSTTVLLSGHDQPQGLCVIRRRGSESKTRVDRSMAASHPSISLLVARSSNAKPDRYSQPILRGEEAC